MTSSAEMRSGRSGPRLPQEIPATCPFALRVPFTATDGTRWRFRRDSCFPEVNGHSSSPVHSIQPAYDEEENPAFQSGFF